MAKQKKLKPLSNLEVSAFCNQMGMVLKSGISSIEGMTILYEDSASPDERIILGQVKDELFASGSLYQALESAGVFPVYMLNMVNIGEQTGTLDEVMVSLAAHYQREDSIARTLKNALTYPLIMIVMMTLVIVLLMVKVMPIFNQVFIQLGQDMTGFSKAVLDAGTMLSRYSMVFGLLVVLIILLIVYFTLSKNGKTAMMRLGYKISFFRDIYEKIAACRFASGMALTLSSGLNPDQSVGLVGELIENPFFRKKVDACKDKVNAGEDFSAALLEAGIFSGVYAKMTSLAAKTGSVDDIMQQVAAQYEEEVDNKITNLISTLEPTLVIILSLIVGIILLSVILPLMGIMSGL